MFYPWSLVRAITLVMKFMTYELAIMSAILILAQCGGGGRIRNQLHFNTSIKYHLVILITWVIIINISIKQ